MGYGIRWLLLSSLRGLTGMARDLLEIKSRVLRAATIQVHSVKPVEPPRHFADPSDDPEDDQTDEDRAAYLAEIEAQNGINEVAVIVNGEARDPEDGKFRGPQRLRFLVGFPRHIDAVKFRYYFEQFGHIALPKGPAALPA
jgi:hypothetical protein